MNPEFWRDKRIFLTGHTGFKGAWLTLWLNHLGAEVMGYALEPVTKPSLYVDAGIHKYNNSIIADIRDREKVNQALVNFQPEIVIHMAAQSLVRYSYKHPVETYETNVIGTINLLEALRCTKSVKCALVITSDKCYENREWPWGYREHEAMGGYDPYSSSKACAELVCSAYRNSYFQMNNALNLATARAGNVIGGGDWSEDRLVPDIVDSLSRCGTVLIRNPHATRPWQHVLDALYGYLYLIERQHSTSRQYAEAWNFGPVIDDCRKVEWVVSRFIDLWGDNASWLVDKSVQPHEAHALKLDCSKAREQLGWKPVMDIEQALEWTVAWYKDYMSGKSANELSVEQIDKFQNLLVSNHA